MKITVDLPDEALPGGARENIAERLRLSLALMMFQSGELSAGAAAELAGVDRFTFYRECGKREIPVINYPPEELEEELERMRRKQN